MKRKMLLLMICLTLIPGQVLAYGMLRQSTTATIAMGTFVDYVDGVTVKSSVTLAPTDYARITKNGGTAVDIKGNTWSAITNMGGFYALTLSTTDTNTLGTLTIAIADADVFLPVWERFQVIAANIYDSLFGNADTLQVDVAQWNNANIATPASSGYPAVTIKDGTGTGEIDTSSGGVLVSAIANNAITAAAIADGAIDEATLASDIATTNDIASAVWDEDIVSGHTTANMAGQMLTAVEGYVDTEVADILTDTGTTLDTKINTINGYLDTEIADILTDTGTTLNDLVDDLESRLTAARAGYLDALNTGVPIVAGGIVAATFGADAITSAAIAANAIGASEIAADAIGASEIAADAIGASEIAADAIGAAEIANNAIDAGALASGCITSAAISTDAIGSSQIAANAIGASEIADNAITNAKIADDVDVDVHTIEGTDASTYIESRTLAAASYFDPAADTVANVTTVATVTNGVGLTATAVDNIWDEDLVNAHSTSNTAGLILSELTKRPVAVFNTSVNDASVIGQMVDDGTASYDRTTESLQAIVDGLADENSIAATVWANATRTMTAIDEDTTTLDIDAAVAAATWNALKVNYNTVGTFGDQPTLDDISTDVWTTNKNSPTADSYGWVANMLLNALLGRMKMDTTANTMTFYDYDDRTSAVGTFYLYDDSTPTRGASHTNVYERDTVTP